MSMGDICAVLDHHVSFLPLLYYGLASRNVQLVFFLHPIEESIIPSANMDANLTPAL